MYHHIFSWNHYDIGFQWGSLLAANSNFILENIPFPLDGERTGFSEKCLPLYKQYFPEILEEIQGIADGQSCAASKIHAFLFSMYALPPACHCSCFAVSAKRQILLGRNSDFLTMLEETNRNVIYDFETGSYAFTGNTTAFVQMEDGINEKGLAVGLTSVFPRMIKPGLNAGMLLRYFLEKCTCTEHALEELKRLPVSSAQTIIFADISGNIALAECDARQIVITRSSADAPYVCATNCFHADVLRTPSDIFSSATYSSTLSSDLQYDAPFPGVQSGIFPPATRSGTSAPGSYNGAGMNSPISFPDDWKAELRYQTLTRTLSHNADNFTLRDGMDLLSGKKGFLCQYDRKSGRDTVWSVLYDLSNHNIYRAEGNPPEQPYREDDCFIF